MVRIAIVEDDHACRAQLEAYVRRYGGETGGEFQITSFSDGLDIAEDYRPIYDIILLDIEMPRLDGMAAAERIRAFDPGVILIFITNMAQYAIKGYEVDALDFVLKPVGYFPFSLKLKKAVSALRARAQKDLLLPLDGGVKRVSSGEIHYIEVQGHRIIVHAEGGDYVLPGALRDMEEQLEGQHFVRCNKCYLVNLRHVTDVRRNTVVAGGHELQVSRPRKKEFLKALTDYYGGGGR